MKTEIVLMTPAFAQEILKKNTKNRKIRRSSVETFRTLLRRGEWVLTHQGVAISSEDVLLDGQHRLLAIVETGIPAKVLFSTDCDPAIYQAIDRGISRTNEDSTQIPRRIIEVLNFFAQIDSGTGRKTPGQLGELDGIFGAQARLLMDAAPSHRAVFSAAPVRAAACLLMMERESAAGEFMGLYRRLTLLDFEGLPPAAATFSKFALRRPNVGGCGGQMMLFCKALKALDTSRPGMACGYDEKARESALHRVNTLISKHRMAALQNRSVTA
jgi:hypothetical protein